MSVFTLLNRFRVSRPDANWRRGLIAAAVLAAPSLSFAQYIYVPSNNQSGNWNAANRWTGGPEGTFPNAVDATATINQPPSKAPSGNYNLQLSNTAGQDITVGAITVNNSALSGGAFRIGANGNGTLTFQASTGSATYTENAGDPDSTFNTNIFAPVTFASDTVITQNHNVDNNNGTQFSSTNNSAGGITAAPGITLTKEGPGNVNFTVAPTAPATGFQGSVVVNNGAVRIEDNVFANAGAVTVNNGGQFQLGSGTIANWSVGPGASLTLNGLGKAAGANAAGALRYNNNSSSASFDSPVVLASNSQVHVAGNLAPTPPNPPAIGHLTLSEVVSGSGALIKSGVGTLTLAEANTYEGGTTIDEGTLSVANTAGSGTGSGPVVVNFDGTLGGTGSIAGAVSFVGGTLAPGASAGTLTLGSTSFDDLASLLYELDTPGTVGSGINDLTDVNGDLTLDGTLDVVPLAGFGIGTYRLFNYTGSLTDNGLVIGSLPAGYTGLIDTSIANQVSLTVAAVPEPSTLALVMAGGIVLGGVRVWNRRRKSASTA